jgi:hypothetical protein
MALFAFSSLKIAHCYLDLLGIPRTTDAVASSESRISNIRPPMIANYVRGRFLTNLQKKFFEIVIRESTVTALQ